MTTKPWRIYTRVSTDDQAKQGASLPAQLASCRALATSRGYILGADVEDAGKSAKSLKRPGVQDLIRAAEEGKLAGVIVYKLDRLTRSLQDLLSLVSRFDALGVGLASVHENLDTSTAVGRFAVQLMGALAELERSQISERVKHVQAHKRSVGAFTGGLIPVGLASTPDGVNRKLIPHPIYGEAVAACWPMVTQGASMRDIARHLDRSLVPSRTGKPWAINGVSSFLRNDTYIGRLVDAVAFQRTRGALSTRFSPHTAKLGPKAPDHSHAKPSDRVWRLQGLAFCGKCGMALAGSQSRGSKGGLYAYLRCTGRLKMGKGFCDAPDLPAEACEDAVASAVVRAVTSDDVAVPLGKEQAQRQLTIAPLKEALGALRMKRDGLSKQVDNLIDLAAQGGLVAQAVSPRLTALQLEANKVEQEVGDIEGRIAAAEISMAELEMILSTLRLGVATLTEKPWEHQQTVLAGLVKRVTVGAGMPLKLELGVPLQVRTDVQEWLPSVDGVRTAKVVVEYPLVRRRGTKGRWLVTLG